MNLQESIVVGLVLRDGRDFQRTELYPEHFTDRRMQTIWEAAYKLERSGRPIDIITVSEELKQMGVLQQTGGVDGLESLAAACSNSSNLDVYAENIRSHWADRTLKDSMQKILVSSALAEDKLDRAYKLCLDMQGKMRIQAQTAKEYIDRIIAKTRDGTLQQLAGLPSGIDLEKYTQVGIPRGLLTVIGAETGGFKTSLAWVMADAMAMAGHNVGFITAEDSGEMVIANMLARLMRIDATRVRNGGLTEKELQLAAALDVPVREAVCRIHVEENIRNTGAACRFARTMARTQKMECLFVDYFQKFDFPRDEYRGLNDLAKKLSLVAHDENIAVVGVSQINMKNVARETGDHKPRLQDFHGSGQKVAEHAKLVLVIYRPSKHEKEPTSQKYQDLIAEKGWEAYESVIEVIIRKNKQGPTERSILLDVHLPSQAMSHFGGNAPAVVIQQVTESSKAGSSTYSEKPLLSIVQAETTEELTHSESSAQS